MLCFGGYKKEEKAICSEILLRRLSRWFVRRKRNGSGLDLVNSVSESKRGKSDRTGAAAVHSKPRARPKPVKKEKIGERIATLQQLVSPFGKTDEAFCYIKFLYDQIQERQGLKSRGLCLAPMAYTAEVASPNGADYWAPAGMEGGSSNLG